MISLRRTSSICFKRETLASYQELDGSMILQFSYRLFHVWLTASSFKHWTFNQEKWNVWLWEGHLYSILSVKILIFKVNFNVLWLNYLFSTEPFISNRDFNVDCVTPFVQWLVTILWLNCPRYTNTIKFINNIQILIIQFFGFRGSIIRLRG